MESTLHAIVAFFTLSDLGALAGVLSLLLSLALLLPPLARRRSRRLLAGLEHIPADVRRNAVRYYIRPSCCSVDPCGEAELRHVIAAEEPLFQVIDRFLFAEGPSRHLLLLGDSGMGKSSFLINYHRRNTRRPTLQPSRRKPIYIVPLGLPSALRDIEAIQLKSQTILFLDALDEDTRAAADYRLRLAEVMGAAQHFYRVVLTCRTQFFRKDEEIPTTSGVLRVGPRAAGDGAYLFTKLYLAPLSDWQIRRYLRKRFPLQRWSQRRRAQAIINAVPLLTARPMLLAHIPDLLEVPALRNNPKDIYRAMIQAWVRREEPWVPCAALVEFSRRLAVNLFERRLDRQSEAIPADQLRPLAEQWGIALDDWQLTSRSLLNRDADGNYKFAHRSIMEFLVTEALTSSQGTIREQFPGLCRQLVRQFQEAIDSQCDIALNSNLGDIPGLTDVMADFLGTDADQSLFLQLDELRIPDRSGETIRGDGPRPGRVLLQGSPVTFSRNGEVVVIQETVELTSRLTVIAIAATTDFVFATTRCDGGEWITDLRLLKPSDRRSPQQSQLYNLLCLPASPLVADVCQQLYGAEAQYALRLGTQRDLQVIGQSRFALCSPLHRGHTWSATYLVLVRAAKSATLA